MCNQSQQLQLQMLQDSWRVSCHFVMKRFVRSDGLVDVTIGDDVKITRSQLYQLHRSNVVIAYW